MGLYFLSPGAGLRPSEIVYDREGSAFALAGAADAPGYPLTAGTSVLRAAIVGVLVAMAFQEGLRTQLLASLISLAVVSAAHLLVRKRQLHAGQPGTRAA